MESIIVSKLVQNRELFEMIIIMIDVTIARCNLNQCNSKGLFDKIYIYIFKYIYVDEFRHNGLQVCMKNRIYKKKLISYEV